MTSGVEIFVIFLLIGLANVNGMIIKRSERQNNLENLDESAYKVNYDVYPVSQKCGEILLLKVILSDKCEKHKSWKSLKFLAKL